jgi:hypothetical protein
MKNNYGIPRGPTIDEFYHLFYILQKLNEIKLPPLLNNVKKNYTQTIIYFILIFSLVS